MPKQKLIGCANVHYKTPFTNSSSVSTGRRVPDNQKNYFGYWN